jgi:hypothetical protein
MGPYQKVTKIAHFFWPVISSYFFFFLTVTGFELRASHFLARCSNTQATTPAPVLSCFCHVLLTGFFNNKTPSFFFTVFIFCKLVNLLWRHHLVNNKSTCFIVDVFIVLKYKSRKDTAGYH